MSKFVFQRVINVVSCKVQPNFKIFCNMKSIGLVRWLTQRHYLLLSLRGLDFDSLRKRRGPIPASSPPICTHGLSFSL